MFKKYLRSIKSHGTKKFPEESGGFIVDTKFVPFSNDAKDKRNNYEVKVNRYSDLIDKNKIKALVHTHCVENYTDWDFGIGRFPSIHDIETQISWNLPSIILPIMKYQGKFYYDDMMVLGINNKRDLPSLTDRTYVFGLTDCWSYCRDWLWINKNCKVPDFKRQWRWLTGDNSAYLDMSNKDIFMEIDKDELTKGDIVLLRFRDKDFPTHAGIYLGNDTFAHHFGSEKPVDKFNKPKISLYHGYNKFVIKAVRIRDA